MGPPEIAPDIKDWTWVVERRCPECGFDGPGVAATEVAAALRANAADWARLLRHADRDLSARPRPDRWSDLEYAAHVRDVLRLYLERLSLMLDTDDPLYANWDQDRAAIDGRYSELEPQTVAEEILDDAHRLAAAFETVREEEWSRGGRRSDGASFTVSSFARYLLHDPVHHLWDVR